MTASKCRQACDVDALCKGYTIYKGMDCQIYTTALCPTGYVGTYWKNVGELITDAKCGSTLYSGCYIKNTYIKQIPTNQTQCEGIDAIKKELEVLRKPPAFACYRTTPHTGVGIITYTSCNVKNQGMDANSGKFSVDVGTFKYSMTIRKLYVVY